MTYVRSLLHRLNPRDLFRRILALDDTPHSVALGTAIGIFVGCTPTFGIRIALVVLVAFLTRRWFYFNRPAALIATCLFNPVVTVPLYYFDYWVGTLFIDGQATREDFSRILQTESVHEWWNAITWLFIDVGTPMVFGSLVVATIVASATYSAMRWLLNTVHRPRPAL